MMYFRLCSGCIVCLDYYSVTRNPAESALPVQLSVEQARAARQGLKVYCKPIEYYNILHDRALDKPLYLQKCLHYKVQENRKRRQRSGNVTFHFKCCNNMYQTSEVMEDYSCAICLIKCASFKGLKCHLRACHDLFHYEFQLDEDYQVVNVSWKTDEFSSFDSFMSKVSIRFIHL
ncbi:polycomb group protein EMBRYONIC FLOWER 2 [Artemisia annua]|uniref:Polycomb group protein EMBRYONIC FLOWER 2 n=1 Tax=Artemisia annua TaxID=35608 RepID=A0A2U1NVZ0_ARTAN|nr:polycomb group protein EMBRYONIC FLOWER 2 [Artemisia annua]